MGASTTASKAAQMSVCPLCTSRVSSVLSRTWGTVRHLAVRRELLTFSVLGAKGILRERQSVDSEWMTAVGRSQVLGLPGSTEKRANPNTGAFTCILQLGFHI